MKLIYRDLGIDRETGLPVRARVNKVTINMDLKNILIEYKIELMKLDLISSVNPEDIVQIKVSSNWVREGIKWDQLSASPIGVGIEQLLLSDLEDL